MTKTLFLGSRLRYPITITKFLKSPGDEVKKREAVFEYKFKWTKEVGDSFRGESREEEQVTLVSWEAPADGKLTEWRIREGETIEKDGPCMVIEESCSHEVQFQGLCAICGKDMTEIDWSSETPETSRATINMTHDNTGLTVSSNLAARVEHATQRRLLEQRKLSLVVDLDQTIIHACIEPTIGEWQSDPTNPNYEAVKDVRSFQLNDDGPRGLASGCWYYIKMRPGLAEFLKSMADMYEMHVYTMGTRAYALNIAKIIDPDMKYFGNRVISRDENGNIVSKNLHRLFPVSTDMVAIIDDRSDVWPRNRPNLIKVTPYDFFKGIGDINSSFLPKRQDILPSPPKAPNGGGPPTSTNATSASDTSVSKTASALDDLIGMSSGQDKALQRQQAAEQEKSLEKQIKERPLLHMQEELDKEDDMAQKTEEAGDSTQSSSASSAARHHVLRDDDDELTHIGQHLTDLHREFYKSYDEKNPANKDDLSLVPDAGYILDELKGGVLRGAVIVLSGLVPLGVDVLQSELGLQIMSFGASLDTHISKRVTHLVVSTQRPRTEKLRQAAKIPTIKIVNQYWLIDCLSQWKALDETPYLVEVHPSDRKRSSAKPAEEQVSDADEDEEKGAETPTLTIIDESGQPQELEIDEDGDGDDEDEEDDNARRGEERLVIDVDHVMPHQLEEGSTSPIDDLKTFDWEGADDELAEFLGSDASDLDEDEDGDTNEGNEGDEGDDGDQDGDNDESVPSSKPTPSSQSGGKRKAEEDVEGETKRQRLTNGDVSEKLNTDPPAPGAGDDDGPDRKKVADMVAEEEERRGSFEEDLEADLLAELEAQENG
ncbi:hypothetical protein jhhlp_001630 [Lomentospora prolificans]|uniref:RNA polymerase II subunit A C-terminal domain phosphatase n=1 Tax=Lomentospora prolificans TaxID=41688 RepID=A0A2N3NIS0_9PEZI|nr:hypothetical protein jhhlp_001630 [Lomentospora prolificans]